MLEPAWPSYRTADRRQPPVRLLPERRRRLAAPARGSRCGGEAPCGRQKLLCQPREADAPAEAATPGEAPAPAGRRPPPPRKPRPAQEQAPAREAEVPAAAAASAPAPPVAAAVPAAAAAAAAPVATDNAGPARVLSPVVRRLIAEHSLDPASISGTGPGGRITRSDVLAIIDSRNGGTAGPAAAAPAPAASEPLRQPRQRPDRAFRPPASPSAPAAPAAPAPAAPAPAVAGAGDNDTIVPFTNIRRRTAEHMVRSKQTSAHTMVVVEVDYFGGRAGADRRTLEVQGGGGFRPYVPAVRHPGCGRRAGGVPP